MQRLSLENMRYIVCLVKLRRLCLVSREFAELWNTTAARRLGLPELNAYMSESRASKYMKFCESKFHCVPRMNFLGRGHLSPHGMVVHRSVMSPSERKSAKRAGRLLTQHATDATGSYLRECVPMDKNVWSDSSHCIGHLIPFEAVERAAFHEMHLGRPGFTVDVDILDPRDGRGMFHSILRRQTLNYTPFVPGSYGFQMPSCTSRVADRVPMPGKKVTYDKQLCDVVGVFSVESTELEPLLYALANTQGVIGLVLAWGMLDILFDEENGALQYLLVNGGAFTDEVLAVPRFAPTPFYR